MRNGLSAVAVLLLLAGGATAEGPEAVDKVLAEARKGFIYRGQPIHPKLVHEFSPWLSDRRPITLVVDVAAAAGSDEYHDADVTVTGRDVRCRHGVDASAGGTPIERWVAYERLGVTADGTVALRVREWNNHGTGVWTTLLLVRFEQGTGYDAEGKAYDQLLMKHVRSINLGDRDECAIAVEAARVVVGPSTGRFKHRAEPTVIALPRR